MPEHFAFIGSDDPLAPGSVLLWSETVRVLFNCPEGAQRFFSEAQERLNSVSHVYFTQMGPHHTMGFPGMLFTVNDSGTQVMATTAPRDMHRWWASMHRTFYSYGRKLALSIQDFESLSPSSGGAAAAAAASSSAPEQPSQQQQQQPATTFRIVTIPTSASLTTASYLVVAVVAPKFDAATATKLGVKPGPKYALLKQGQRVESDAQPGTFVEPAQVLLEQDAATAGGAVLIADYDLPSSSADCSPLDLDAMEQAHCGRNGTKIHTVIHVAQYPLPFEFKRRFLRADVLGGEREDSSETFDFTDSSGRRHVLSPNSRPPAERLRLSAFPTSQTMRMHLRLVAPELFPEAAVSSNAHHHREQQTSGGAVWPFSPSRCLKLRLGDGDARPKNNSCNKDGKKQQKKQQGKNDDGDDDDAAAAVAPVDDTAARSRFPGNDVVVPSPADSLGMLSAELLQKFKQFAADEAAQHQQRQQGSDAASSLAGGIGGCQPHIEWIRFGGTGSAVPNKYRNVSSIPLCIAAGAASAPSSVRRETVLFDCGEGTAGQLLLALGPQGLREYMRDLSFVHISHLHADHHFGLFTFLSLRRWLLADGNGSASNAVRPPLPIVAPLEVIRYFLDLLFVSQQQQQQQQLRIWTATPFSKSVGEIGRDFFFVASEAVAAATSASAFITVPALVGIHNDDRFRAFGQPTVPVLAADSASSALFRFRLFAVDHPGSAHGIRIDCVDDGSNNNGAQKPFPRSILYTGDTRPCDAVASAARGVDLLIHEATFDSSMGVEAKAKMHSTVDEAIATAERATDVKYLMLNHFSQRYPKMAVGANAASSSSTAAAAVSSNSNGNGDTSAASSTPPPLPEIGASCDLICLSGGARAGSFAQLRRALPVFQALLDEYESWGTAQSLSRRLRSN